MVTIDVGKLKQCVFWVERAYMVAMIILLVMEKVEILMCLLYPSTWSVTMSVFLVTNVLYMFSALLALHQAPGEKMKVEEEDEFKEVKEEVMIKCENNAKEMKQDFEVERRELLLEVDGLTEDNRRLSEALDRNKQLCIKLLEKMNYYENDILGKTWVLGNIFGKMKYYEECCAVYVDQIYDLTEINRRLSETLDHFKEQDIISNYQSSSYDEE